MNINPKKIARLISEDPDVAPGDHFDDTEDEYVSLPDFWNLPEFSGDSWPCHKCKIPVFGQTMLTRQSGLGQYCESCNTMWCGDCAEAAVAQTRLSFDDYYGNGVHTECPNCAEDVG